MTTLTYVDPLGPTKTWLRTQSFGVSQRAYIGDPERATKPYVSMLLVDGGDSEADTPLAHPRVQFAVQADTEETAAAVVWALVSLLQSTPAGTRFDSTYVCMGARRTLGPVPRLDEAGPRYLVEFEIAGVAR